MKVIEFLEYVDKSEPIIINIGNDVERYRSKEDIEYQLLRSEVKEIFVFEEKLNILIEEKN